MAFGGSAASADIIIPKGVVIAYPITGSTVGTEGIDLGYCQEAALEIAEERREVYTARDSSRAKIVDRVVQTDYSIRSQLFQITLITWP